MEQYRETGITRINDFLTPGDADFLAQHFEKGGDLWKFAYCANTEVLYYELGDNIDPLRRESEYIGFGYHYNILNEVDSQEVQDFRKLLLQDEVKGLLYENTGETYTSVEELFCTKYLPGDYLGMHHDSMKGKLAFVYHLSPTWNFTWGGITYYFSGTVDDVLLENIWENFDQMKLQSVAKPKFNSLVLLDVSRGNYHFVSHLNPNAPYPRISINGWLS